LNSGYGLEFRMRAWFAAELFVLVSEA